MNKDDFLLNILFTWGAQSLGTGQPKKHFGQTFFCKTSMFDDVFCWKIWSLGQRLQAQLLYEHVYRFSPTPLGTGPISASGVIKVTGFRNMKVTPDRAAGYKITRQPLQGPPNNG